MNRIPLVIYILVISFLFAFTLKTASKNFTVLSDTIAPISFNAKDHKAKSSVSSSESLTLTTGLSNDYYLADSSTRVVYFYAETKLEKLLNNFSRRLPLNISVVIDHSASMEGIKMGYAKRAAKGIIDQLNRDDIVSIVIYDTYVDTVQSPINVIDKEKIKAKIDRISPRSSTNLWGGAEQGYQYVQKNYKPGFINRVLLISDGNANTGLTDSAIIHQKVQKYKDDNGISISTFGVGLDYNETLMTDMAETGAGNYYFIDAPDKMTAIFSNEIKGLLNVIAQDAELKIKLPKGISVLKNYPLGYIQKGDEVTIKLKDLSPGDTKATLFVFKIENKYNGPLIFNATLSYTDAMDGQSKTITSETNLNSTKNLEAYATHFNKEVIEQAILYTTNARLEAAMNLMEKGAYKEAETYLADNASDLKANSFYVTRHPLLSKIDSVNKSYKSQYSIAKSVSADSAKKVQKTTRAVNYKIRNKKE